MQKRWVACIPCVSIRMYVCMRKFTVMPIHPLLPCALTEHFPDKVDFSQTCMYIVQILDGFWTLSHYHKLCAALELYLVLLV